MSPTGGPVDIPVGGRPPRKRPLSQVDRDFIESIKRSESFEGFEARVGETETYRLQILGRGEMAFYQEGGRALLFEIDPRGGILSRSIRRWDDGLKVTNEERAVVVDRMSAYLRSRGVEDVRVI